MDVWFFPCCGGSHCKCNAPRNCSVKCRKSCHTCFTALMLSQHWLDRHVTTNSVAGFRPSCGGEPWLPPLNKLQPQRTALDAMIFHGFPWDCLVLAEIIPCEDLPRCPRDGDALNLASRESWTCGSACWILVIFAQGQPV